MRKSSARNGSALILAVVVVILAAGLGGAFWSMSIHSAKNSQRLTDDAEAQMIADAGLEMARAAMVKWRNDDPYKKEGQSIPTPVAAQYSWNKVFQHCIDSEAPKVGMGVNASADVIREDALSRLSGSVDWVYGPDRTANGYNVVTTNHTVFGMTDKAVTSIDSCIQDLFCINRRYGKGAFHLSMRNNTGDLHGDGIDNSRPPSGNPWFFDQAQTQTTVDPVTGTTTTTTVYPGDPSDGYSGTFSPVIDGDGQAILTITATLPNGTCRQIEVFVSFPFVGGGPVNAIQDNGDIRMQGNFNILGQLGRVFANGNVTGNGSAGANVSQSVSAAGDASGLSMSNPPPGGIQSGAPPIDIQPVNMDTFLDPADTKYAEVRQNMFELRKDGTVRKWTGGIATPYVGLVPGLKYMSGNQTEPWKVMDSSQILDAAYWVEGNFSVQGNNTGTATKMTILATGSVDMQGSAMYTSATSAVTGQPLEQLIVAGADVRLRGTATSGLNYTGAIFANEQVAISGTFNMNGSITAANVTDSPLSAVTSNTSVAPDLTVQGTPTITYNGGGSIIKQETDHLNVRGLHRTR
jgi:hypothetical protein